MQMKGNPAQLRWTFPSPDQLSQRCYLVEAGVISDASKTQSLRLEAGQQSGYQTGQQPPGMQG